MCGISKGSCGTHDMEQAQYQKKKEEGRNRRKMWSAEKRRQGKEWGNPSKGGAGEDKEEEGT